jgi:hypothetical protein
MAIMGFKEFITEQEEKQEEKMLTQKFNRGDVAEGILGAALTAKFTHRSPGKMKDPVTKAMIDYVLDQFFRANTMIEFKVKDVAASKGSAVVDGIRFSINLPTAAANLLKDKNSRKVVDDLYDSAIEYVEKAWEEDVIEIASNGTVDEVLIMSDGVGDQKGTKADIKVTVNGKPYRKQISLKVAGGEQFAQVSGDDFEKQQKVWEDILGLNIAPLEKKYNEAIKNYDKKEFFSSREEKRLHEFKDMIKTAAGIVYQEAAKQIQLKINSKNTEFFTNFAKLVFEGATKGDQSIELVKLQQRSFKQLKFDANFIKNYSEQLKKSNLKAKFRESGDPLVQIFAGSESKSNLILQIRVKVEAASRNTKAGKVYSPYMRNYVEAGPLMFNLL